MIESFSEWKEALHKEDIWEFGRIVKRPESAYFELYRIYKKSKSENDN